MLAGYNLLCLNKMKDLRVSVWKIQAILKTSCQEFEYGSKYRSLFIKKVALRERQMNNN